MNLSVHGYEWQRELVRAALERCEVTFVETSLGFELYGMAEQPISVRFDKQAAQEQQRSEAQAASVLERMVGEYLG